MSRKLKWIFGFGMIFVLIFGLVGQAFAAGDKESPGSGRMIVMFEKDFNPIAQEALVKRFGGETIKSLGSINGLVVMLPPQAAAGIAKSHGVLSVELDGTVQATEQTIPWGVNRIDAEVVHATNKGAGVRVAVIDTGVDYTHPDLTGNFDPEMLGYDFVNNDADPMDDNSHGTHVAGIIAAEDNDLGVVGVAPEANLYALKVLNSTGFGYYSDIIGAIEWCIDNDIQVANMSFGGTYSSDSLKAACDNAYNNGVLLVAAAGNFDDNTIIYPAKYDSVIAVSATAISDGLAYFSSYGDQVELAAPGVSINSTLPGGLYGAKSGTSMASPHVTGAAALVIASGVTGSSAVRTQLDNTAEDLGVPGRDQNFGFGLVDVEAAASSPVATGTISGTVTDIDTRNPVADAVVTAGVYSTKTAADGSFTLAGLPVGTYTVTASVESYIDASREVVVQEATTSVAFFSLDLQPIGSIAGKVTDTDTNFSISNAVVTAGIYSTTAAADGSYTLAGLPAGTYTVTVSAANYIDESRDVVVREEATSVADFILEPQPVGSLTGKVTDAETSNPIAAAVVTVGEYSTTTAGDGTYTLANLPVGTYNFAVSASGYSNESRVVIVEQNATSVVDFALEPLPGGVNDMYVQKISLSKKQAGPNTFLLVDVRIARDSNMNGSSDESDLGVAGATVKLTLSNINKGVSWTYTGITDSNGQVQFSLKKAPDGEYEAKVNNLTHSSYNWSQTLDTQGMPYTLSY